MSGGILSGGYCPGGYCPGGYCPDTKVERLHQNSSSDCDSDCTLVGEQTPMVEKFCRCGGPAYLAVGPLVAY